MQTSLQPCLQTETYLYISPPAYSFKQNDQTSGSFVLNVAIILAKEIKTAFDFFSEVSKTVRPNLFQGLNKTILTKVVEGGGKGRGDQSQMKTTSVDFFYFFFK